MCCLSWQIPICLLLPECHKSQLGCTRMT
jgi:hypothetical protein